MSSQIPIIDLSDLDENKSKLAKQLHIALRDIGFVYIKGHGVDPTLEKNLFEISKKFFDKDLNFKNSIQMEKAGRAWRGFFSTESEMTNNSPDQKEGLYFGIDHPNEHIGITNKWPMHGRNLWPEGNDLTKMKQDVTMYISMVSELAQKVLSLAAVGLGAEEHYFQSRFTQDPHILFRIFNYPNQPISTDNWGVGAHTDMGFLTILLQDDSGGLQIQARDGSWIDAPPIPGTFIVNIGDMLEFWTRGIYRATLHRVKNISSTDRLSLPFFFDPNWKTTLEPIPLESLRKEDLKIAEKRKTEERWDSLNLDNMPKNTTYGEFVWKKIRNVFPNLVK